MEIFTQICITYKKIARSVNVTMIDQQSLFFRARAQVHELNKLIYFHFRR